MGLMGQGARAAVGLKKANALGGQPSQDSEFSAAYFALSLMIGFIAGVLAGLALGLQYFVRINLADIKMLLGVAASGYAGADFIENSLSIFLPPSTCKTTQSAAAPAAEVSRAPVATEAPAAVAHNPQSSPPVASDGIQG
jgi:hypothetical protein